MKNGFALMSFLFLIPVLFLAALVTYFSFDIVKNYSTAQNECRDHVLNAQKIMGAHLEMLMALNPQAEALRAEGVRLRQKLKMVRGTPLESIVIGLIAKNTTGQMILRTKQEGLVATAQSKAQSILIDFTKKNLLAQIPRASLQIERKPQSAIAPNFYPVPNFEKAQTTKVSWKTQAFQSIFKKILPKVSQNLMGSCSATLKKGEDAWNPQINEDKFSSNAPSLF